MCHIFDLNRTVGRRTDAEHGNSFGGGRRIAICLRQARWRHEIGADGDEHGFIVRELEPIDPTERNREDSFAGHAKKLADQPVLRGAANAVDPTRSLLLLASLVKGDRTTNAPSPKNGNDGKRSKRK